MNKLKNQKNTRLWIDEKTRKKINQIKKSLKKSFEKVLKSKSKNKQKIYQDLELPAYVSR